MRKAQARTTELEFFEKHHVFPKSIYGKNNKLVKLTPREHYVAHALLYKAMIKRYGEKHDSSKKMIYAFWAMHMKYSKVNSRLYETLKLKRSEVMKNSIPWNKGVPISEEARKKLSKSRTGMKLSEEARKNMSKPRSEEHRKNISKGKKGMKWWNNGVNCVLRAEAPEGYERGRLTLNKKL